MRTSLPLLVLLIGASAPAQSNPDLEKANKYLFDQKYVEAAKALEAAAKTPGNSRELVTRIYELQGVVYGQLGQTTKSREAFQALLALDPKRELNGKYSQKVTASFSAAKEWANTNPPIDFKAAKAAIDEKGKVMQLASKLKNDAMRLTRKVRFHLRPDDANRWSVQDSELQGAYAAANTDATGVEWWAELLGENDRVLMVVGSESMPVREGKVKDRPGAVEASKKDAPKVADAKVADAKVADTKVADTKVADAKVADTKVADAKVSDTKVSDRKTSDTKVAPDQKLDAAIIDEPSGPSSGAMRPMGIVLVAAGLVGVGVGGAFGFLSGSARSQVTNAAKNAGGIVTGVTQKRAFELDAEAKSQALIANVMFGVGGGIAVLGGVFFLVGGSTSDAQVSIAPTVGGAVLSGSW